MTAMQEKDLQRMTPDAKAYFDSLPPMLQTTVMQSNVTMTTREQLETYCNNVLKSAKSDEE